MIHVHVELNGLMEHLRNIRIVTVNRMIDRSTLRLKIKEISLNLTEIEDIFSKSSTESKIKELEAKLADYEDKYYAKFSKMEVALSKLQNSTNSLISMFGGGQ